ncbi:VOC family protein [Paenibacillus ehimensis]|uniref:VOC family protein n=1 Tax=Paenibacillus ehimensis TaxID=79264 RepID=A0ABT8VGR1_9BACL|nr:VOC family protein [Paenibacillus ehimensis]MDO3680139.1 VOC family protein [Paenibacillus ehimensis]MEC0207794.1 VOC family protein [Paenibacillus ehimensis]
MSTSNALFTGIPGIFVPVRDLNRSAAWYSTVLGLQEFQRSDITVEFKVGEGGPVLVLFQAEHDVPVRFPGNRHIDGNFFIFKTPDAEAAHRLLTDHGVPVTDILLYEGVQKYFFFEDPDGNRLSVED